jgi:hypothetical protein
MREISDRSPSPAAVHVPASNPPPIVEPSALRKRSSNPPSVDEGWDLEAERVEERSPLASLPPDAMVPAAGGGDEQPITQPSEGSSPAPIPEPAPEHQDEPELDAPFSSPFAVTTEALPLPAAPAESAPRTIEPTAPLPLPAPAPSVVGERDEPAEARPTPPKKGSPWTIVLIFAALGLGVGLVLHTTGDRVREPEPPPVPSTSPPPAGTAPPAASTAGTAATSPAPSVSAEPDDLPAGLEVPPSYGVIAVSAAAGVRVRIDGAIAGVGPSVSLVAAPGMHDVRLEVDPDAAPIREVVEVRTGKTARVRFAPSP